MRGANLAVNSNLSSIKGKFEEILNLELKRSPQNNPDVLFVHKPENKKSIGIEQIRQAIRFLDEKPLQEKIKAIVVPQANLLTKEAQNAFLKTLEEPPNFALILLGSKSSGDLLETVISRCKRILITEKALLQNTDQTRLSKMRVGDRLSWALENSKLDREEIIVILEQQILLERNAMLESPNKPSANNLETLLNIKTDLEKSNIGAKFALEQLSIALN